MNARNILLGGMVVTILMLAACGPAVLPVTEVPIPTVDATQFPPLPLDHESVTFGVVAPMTDDAADYGIKLEQGMRLAVDEINAAGGMNGKTVKLEICDDICTPYDARLCAQKMVMNPNILAVVGHVCSDCTLAAGPIYEQAGLSVMTVNSTHPSITQQGWRQMFRTIPNDRKQGALIAEVAINKLGNYKAAIIYADSEYGRGIYEVTQDWIAKLGGEVVAVQRYTPGVDKDFRAKLARIAATRPDVLILLTDFYEGGLIAQQRMYSGLGDLTVIASGANTNLNFIKLGGEGAEGVLFLSYFDPNFPGEAVQAFVRKYLARYGEKPVSEIAAYGYDAVYIFKEAVARGATRENFSEVLRTVSYNGVTGMTEFGQDGDALIKLQYIMTVKYGRFASYIPRSH